MNGGIKLVCFLLLIPFFAAIGHDLYTAYLNDPSKVAKLEALQINPQDYQVSDAGYILLEYAPGFYEQTRTLLGERAWVGYIDPILKQYTFVIALVPAVLFYFYLLVAFVIGIPPFAANKFKQKSMADMDTYERRDTGSAFKYKRK